MHNSGLIIVGPTCSGKTALAVAIARAQKGVLINADKTFCYRGFPISTGLADVLNEQVDRRLYEFLEPMDELPSPEEFIGMMASACRETRRDGRLPVIEGGSTTLLPALLDKTDMAEIPTVIIGIRPPAPSVVESKVRSRLDAALMSGLLEEVASHWPHHRQALVMTTGCAVTPLVRYLDGLTDLNTAKEQIIVEALAYACRQMEVLERYSQIQWLDHGPGLLAETQARLAQA